MTLTTLTIRNNIHRAYYSDDTSLIISKGDAEGLAKTYNIKIENEGQKRLTKTEIENRKEQQAIIAKIAAEHGIVTLDSRDSDRLDFHDIAVWTLEEMLDAAYEAGRYTS